MRTIRYGASITLVLVGTGCGIAIPGSLGGTLATVFVGLGLVGVVTLIFYEVGLTEDRDRRRSDPQSRADRGAADAPPIGDPADPASPPATPLHPSAPLHPPGDPARLRPDRMRGQRRRLR